MKTQAVCIISGSLLNPGSLLVCLVFTNIGKTRALYIILNEKNSALKDKMLVPLIFLGVSYPEPVPNIFLERQRICIPPSFDYD